jgi:molybdopterin-guanine dinucleotide biosynthesis protein A
MPQHGRLTREAGWLGAILAGGGARRFGGREKATLPVGGMRLVDRQLAAFDSLGMDVVAVVDRAARAEGWRVSPVVDLVPGAGPLGALFTALSQPGVTRVLAVACDMPFVTPELLAHVASRLEGADAAVPLVEARYQPLCAAYASSCAPVFEAALGAGQRAVTQALAGLRVHDITAEELAGLDPSGRALANVNSEADYVRWIGPTHP